jgi:hypothetical protein
VSDGGGSSTDRAAKPAAERLRDGSAEPSRDTAAEPTRGKAAESSRGATAEAPRSATGEPLRGAAAAFATAAVALLALAVNGAALLDAPQQLEYLDALDYAQMGRQLASGAGFSSLQTFPFVVGWLEAGGFDAAPPWPNVWRFPLPVSVRAASFALLGATDLAARVPTLLFSVATAAALFALANRLGGALAAALASALWIASAGQQQLAISGLTEAGASFFVTALALAALHARHTGSTRSALALGALLGLAWLQRSNLLALAPGCALVVVLSHNAKRRVGRQLGAVAFAAALVAAPWLLRNAWLFGDPLLNLTGDRALLRLLGGADPFSNFSLAAASHGTALLGPALAALPAGWNLASFADALGSGFGRDFRWLGPALILATLADARAESRATTFAVVGALLLSAAILLPVYPDVLRFYWPYAPPLLALVCASALHAALRLGGRRAAVAVAAVGFAIFALAAPREAAAPLKTPGFRGVDVAGLGRALPAGSLVASDLSAHVAWQAGQPAIRFADGYEELDAIEAVAGRLSAIVGSSSYTRRHAAALGAPPLSERYPRSFEQQRYRVWLHRSAQPAN